MLYLRAMLCLSKFMLYFIIYYVVLYYIIPHIYHIIYHIILYFYNFKLLLVYYMF